MKLILLAAVAAFAAPALAAPAQTADQAQSDQAATTGQNPIGGYEPATPAMSAPAQPGAKIVFVPSQSPDQAFPPPPAMASYPWCKPGQTDKCKERGSRP